MHTIGFLTSDLMFHSRVSQSLSDLKTSGVDVSLVVNRNIQTLIEKLSSSNDVRLIIVDLALKDLDIGAVATLIREQFAEVPVIAYGPHVANAMLQAAVDAGLDEVYTRGQFDHRMTEIITQFSRLSSSNTTE